MRALIELAAAIACPHCDARARLVFIDIVTRRDDGFAVDLHNMPAYKCSECGRVSHELVGEARTIEVLKQFLSAIPDVEGDVRVDLRWSELLAAGAAVRQVEPELVSA